MIKVDRATFAKFMHSLAAALPKWSPDIKDHTVMEVWYDSLCHLTVDELRVIYRYAKNSLDDFPSIKRMLQIVSIVTPDGLPADPFSELIRCVQTQKFDCHSTVFTLAKRLGGWEAIGMWQIEHYELKRKTVDTIWRDVIESYKVARELCPNDVTQLPPAHVLKVIQGGFDAAKDSKEQQVDKNPKVDRTHISLAHWLHDIKK